MPKPRIPLSSSFCREIEEEGADGRMRGHVSPSSILVRPQRAGYCRNIEIERPNSRTLEKLSKLLYRPVSISITIETISPRGLMLFLPLLVYSKIGFILHVCYPLQGLLFYLSKRKSRCFFVIPPPFCLDVKQLSRNRIITSREPRSLRHSPAAAAAPRYRVRNG